MPASRKPASKSAAAPASRAVVKATSRAVAKQPSRAVVKATTRAVTTASKVSKAVAKVPSRAVVPATTRAMTTTPKASRAVAKPETKSAGGGKMPKASPELIARLDAAMEPLPAYRRPMFGTVAWWLESNAQMFAGVWGEEINVRVGVEEAARLIASNTAREFAPMPGRPMREYVLLDASTLRAADLRKWLQRAVAYAETLAAKK